MAQNYRDKSCLRCGSRRRLEAHHISPKSKFPHRAYQIKNGATLCRKCHRTGKDSYHKLYGIGDKKSFNKWLKLTYKRDKIALKQTIYLLLVIFVITVLIGVYFKP